jgi:hypothetical protein
VNLAGLLVDDRLTRAIPVRIYIDLDPVFTQLWHAVEGIDMRFDGHTHFVTVGLALARGGGTAPSCGRDWIATLPPVVLDLWPQNGATPRDALTTVGNWRAYGSVEHDGVFYGQKAHALRPLAELPRRCSQRLELALAIDPGETADLALLAQNGWQLVDPHQVAATPAAYQRYVSSSWGEFGLAKHGYVVSGCGWFSDRSAVYLASGRPVIALETGFSRFLPAGEGLFAVSGLDEIVAAIEQLRQDYGRHAAAAVDLAREFFDSDRVLARLLERVGAG